MIKIDVTRPFFLHRTCRPSKSIIDSCIESKIRKGHKISKIILRISVRLEFSERFLFGLAGQNKFGKGYGLQSRCKKKGWVTSYFQIIKKPLFFDKKILTFDMM